MSFYDPLDPTWYPLVDDTSTVEAANVNDVVVFINGILTGLPEAIRDAALAAIAAGTHTGISFSVNDGADRVDATVLAEYVQDTVGPMLTGGTHSGVSVAYQDGTGTLDLTVTPASVDTEAVHDIIISTISGSNGITVTDSDAGNTTVIDGATLQTAIATVNTILGSASAGVVGSTGGATDSVQRRFEQTAFPAKVTFTDTQTPPASPNEGEFWVHPA